jgi:mono/diheme cytochrome c family protein
VLGKNMSRYFNPVALATALVLCAGGCFAADGAAPQVERGKYLVTVMSCTDCHTPGGLVGKPDMARYLGGSEVGFALPGLGVFLGSNLTPDKETGIGDWTLAEIATAIRIGKTPDGRQLAPVMPVASFSHLTPADGLAIAAYLKTLPPVRNKVAGPFGPDQKPTSLVMTVLPATTYWTLPRNAPPAK